VQFLTGSRPALRTARPLRGTRRERGQALTEFALLLPLIVVLFFGIIQFGFLFGGQIALVNAVREAARYTSTSPINSNPTTQVRTVLGGAIPGYNGTATILYAYCYYANPATAGPTTYSARVRIDVTYGHPLFIPIVGMLIDGLDGANDNKFTAHVAEEMRVESQPLSTPPGGVTTVCTNP
jgi:Flp pilus assembly protein TadG